MVGFLEYLKCKAMGRADILFVILPLHHICSIIAYPSESVKDIEVVRNIGIGKSGWS